MHEGMSAPSRTPVAMGRSWEVLLATLVLLAALGAALAIRSGSPPGASETPALSLPASAPTTQSATSRVPDKTDQRVTNAYGKLPLTFIPNKGQTDDSVRYHAQGGGFGFYFTDDKAVMSFSKGERGQALELRFLGANPNAALTATRPGEGKVNYLVGSERHTNLPTYEQLTYRNLWPGIDMVFKGKRGELVYEFLVKPGADPSKIGLSYEGASNLSLTKSGALSIQTRLGTLRDSAPRSYQVVNGKKVAVGSSFALRDGNAYGFALGPTYDAGQPLVIDPGIVYSTFLGGSSSVSDLGADIAIDGTGSAYVVGSTPSSNFPTTAGAFDTTYNGDNTTADVFVTKLNPAGSALDYSTFLGGTAGDIGRGIAVDGSGSAYVSGWTNAVDFPTTVGAFDTSYNANPFGGQDAFVTKLNASGSALVYSTYLGESGLESTPPGGIAVDGAGNAYVTGDTQSSDFPTTAGAFDTVYKGIDVFVTKLNAAGSALVYSTYLAGDSFTDTSGGIAIDSGGSAYVTGWTNSSIFPTTVGTFDVTHNGGTRDAFVTKFNAAGSGLVYSTFLGGSANDQGEGIDVDGGGKVYVTGQTSSSAFPTTVGAFDTSYNGGGSGDAFVTTFSASGSTLGYSTFLGGTSTERGEGIAVDGSGSAYVTGDTSSTGFPTTAGAHDTVLNGAGDAFVTKLNAAGSAPLDYSTFLGGSCSGCPSPVDGASEIVVDASANAYVTGETSSTSGFPTTAGAFDTSFNSSGSISDAFVTKFSLPINDESESVPPGSTASTNTEVSAQDPTGTSVTNPSAGAVTRTVTIAERATTATPASGFNYLSRQADITVSSAATAADPLTIVFRVDASLLPFGINETNLQVFRNGTQVPACTGSPGTASPDPCVSARTALGGGDVAVTVLSSAASTWNFGVEAGEIVVVKDAIPDGPQDFTFTAGGGLSPASFSLDDDSDPTLSNTQTFDGVAPGSGYSLSEAVPSGWDQQSATCSDGSPVSNISVSAGETVTCTFTNAKRGQIVVVKDAVPNDPQDFSFTAGGGLTPASFSLDDDSDATLSNTRTFSNLAPGSGYSLSEAPPSGWKQAQATCSDGSPPSNIDVAPGESVTCTFVNQKALLVAPMSASSLNVSLVPDFRQTISTTQCSARSGTPSSHGLPDLPGGTNPDGSCNPPAFAPGTVGHLGTQASASASLTVVPGDLTTPADEADVAVAVSATDVRGGSATGSDYNPVAAGPDLTLSVKLRLSDTLNGPSQDEPATMVDNPLLVPVACTTTASTTVGSNCSAATTLDGVTPGMVPEGKSSVLQSFRVRLLDSGADGVRNNTDDRGFAMQGVYVP